MAEALLLIGLFAVLMYLYTQPNIIPHPHDLSVPQSEWSDGASAKNVLEE